MSANAKSDLEQVKSIFEKFRAGRQGKERLPENLWTAAIELLEHYPFREVWRELRVKPEYLRRRAEEAKGIAAKPVEISPHFLTVTGRELTADKDEAREKVAGILPNQASECRLVLERCDGSRLTLNLPIDWAHIETMCASFLRG
jgi:hypothetical protein